MPLPPHRLPGHPVAWGKLTSVALALCAALLALVLGAAGGPVGAAEPARGSVVVSAADDGRLLTLRRGQQLRVVLADTAGTGYSWEIEHYDPKLLAPEGQRSEQEPQPTRLPKVAPGGTAAPSAVGAPSGTVAPSGTPAPSGAVAPSGTVAPNGPPMPRVVGGPMRVSFQFRVIGQGKGELRLRHWRPWEGEGSIDRRFKLALRVVG
ncbi:MAG: protease inhibitor I42 family protein [Cyanobacteriota bacterium]|nr:protease inhibitor I42 family protein [Cyanobacteriota bacterium]